MIVIKIQEPFRQKKAKYYALLAMDVNNYLTEEFEGFNDSDEVFYNKKNGGFTDASTVMDENGNEKDLANNPNYDSMTVKEAKEKEYNRLIQENEYFDYIKKIKEKGFDSMDPNSPEKSFLGVNNDNILVNIHYDATNKTLDLDIRRQ